MKSSPSFSAYRVISRLGQGAFSTVYLGESTITGERCALKVFCNERDLSRASCSVESIRDHFRSELKTLARLSHPNLVKLRGFGKVLKTHQDFLAIEYLDGEDFVSASKQVSQEQFYSMLVQVCRVLDYLHRRGLSHGDLKPNNLVVSEHRESHHKTPIVKLVDLGTAGSPERPPDQTVAGSAYYVAPEIIRGERSTISSDLYSFGAILYECLSGDPPFAGKHLGEILQRHLEEALYTIEGKTLRELHPLVRQLLNKDPARRPATPAETFRLLNAAAPSGPYRLHTAETWEAHVRSSPLVGREELFSKIDDSLTRIDRKSSGTQLEVMTISGEPGSGISRVLNEIGVRARLRGVPVMAIPHRSLHGRQPGSSRELFEYMDHAQKRGTVFVCDCRGPSDIDPLSLLQSMKLNDLPCFLLVVGVESPPSSTGIQTFILGSNSRPVHYLEWRLKPLNEMQILEAMQGMLSVARVEPAISRFLISQTSGNSRLVAESFSSLLDLGFVDLQGDSLHVASELSQAPVPRAAEAFLTELWTVLSDVEKRTAAVLAVSKDSLGEEDLLQLTSLAHLQIQDACARLIRIGIVQPHSREAHVTYKIAGELWRNHILSSFTPDDRTTLHKKMARWCLAEENPRRSVALAAINFIAGGSRDDAITYCVQAAQHFNRLAAFHRGAEFYGLALSQKPSDATLRAEITLGLSKCLVRSGKIGDAHMVLAALPDVQNLPAKLRVAIQLHLAYCLEGMGDYLGQETIARRALTQAIGAGLRDQVVEARSALGSSLCWQEKREEGRRLLFHASTQARRFGMRFLVALALFDVSSSFWKEGKYKKALRYERRRLRLLRDTEDPFTEVSARLNIGVLLCDQGSYSEARRQQRDVFRSADVYSMGAHKTASLVNLGNTYQCQGRWRQALRYNREAILALEGFGATQQRLMADSNVAGIMVRIANYEQSLDLLKHKLGESRKLGGVRLDCSILLNWGMFLLGVGHTRLAQRVLQHSTRLCEKSQLWQSLLESRMLLALALLRDGKADSARRLLVDAIEKYESRSPFDVRLSARLALVEIEQQLGAAFDAIESSLAPLIETSRSKRMHWHQSWGLMLRAESLLAASRGIEAEMELVKAVRVARKNADRNTTWHLYHLLGRVNEQALRYERAFTCYRAAALTVREIAMDIHDERFRSSFLDQVEVRETLEAHRRLREEVGKQARHNLAVVNRNEMISRKMLASLSAIGTQLSSILDLDRLLSSILDLAIENVRAERGIVFLRDSSSGEMRPECARGLNRESLEEVTAYSRSAVRQVAGGVTLLTVDVGANPSMALQESIVLHGIKSILCVPMRARGAVAGVIYLDTRRAPQLFTDKERSFVESFASQAAIAIENARLFGQMRAENARLRAGSEVRFKGLVGASPAMERLNESISGVMKTDCNVLITGESGTGKEIVARAIHNNGPRQGKTLVAVDCGALPENLLEAELFGHARGAYTGADRERVGLIEAAHGGTLFLDEIANTTTALQTRLLRVLQEREVRRIGENHPRQVDVRFIAATNADLGVLIQQGRFRQDLYYRLNVVTIEVPPLRERRADIPLLIDHILRARSEDGRPTKQLGPGVAEALSGHDWPGNIRELENVLERLTILAPGNMITVSDLPDPMRPPAMPGPALDQRASPHGKSGEQVMIEDALRRCGGDKAKAARFIGWNRQKIYRRMKLYRIPRDYGRAA